MGYGETQMRELKETLERVDADVVLVATPIDLGRLLELDKPVTRVRYELAQVSGRPLREIVAGCADTLTQLRRRGWSRGLEGGQRAGPGMVVPGPAWMPGAGRALLACGPAPVLLSLVLTGSVPLTATVAVRLALAPPPDFVHVVVNDSERLLPLANSAPATLPTRAVHVARRVLRARFSVYLASSGPLFLTTTVNVTVPETGFVGAFTVTARSARSGVGSGLGSGLGVGFGVGAGPGPGAGAGALDSQFTTVPLPAPWEQASVPAPPSMRSSPRRPRMVSSPPEPSQAVVAVVALDRVGPGAALRRGRRRHRP